MGQLFDDLCRGPVVVVDDGIDREADINNLISQFKGMNLPILPFTSVEAAKNECKNLLFVNFVVLDWRFLPPGEVPTEVQVGAEVELASEREVIDLINQLQKMCLAPIFLLTAWDTEAIKRKLEESGIETGANRSVFVESKSAVCNDKEALVGRIEEWIAGSPHVYLAKWWIQELLVKNTQTLWELYAACPDWPRRFIRLKS